MPVNRSSSRAPQRQRRFALPLALWTAGIAVVSVAASTQACTVLLPWDGYVGMDDAGVVDAQAETAVLDAAVADATVADALVAVDSSGGNDGSPDGALTPLEVACGTGLSCKVIKACCLYGDGRKPGCATSCAVDEAGAVLHCDSPSDCLPGQKCCVDFHDGGSVNQTLCTNACAVLQRVCDPALGSTDCTSTTTCTHQLEAGVVSLTMCELAHDQ